MRIPEVARPFPSGTPPCRARLDHNSSGITLVSDLFGTLLRTVNSRLQFLEGKDRERCLKRGDLIFADNKMLAATEKTLGKNHILVATGYEYMSNCYGDLYDWQKCASYSLTAHKIKELNWGTHSAQIAGDTRSLVKKLYKAGRYKDVLVYGQRMVELGTKYSEKQYTQTGKSYVALAKRKMSTKST